MVYGLRALLGLGLLCSTASAAVRNNRNVLNKLPPPNTVNIDIAGSANPNLGMAYYDSYIDHNNKSLGMFKLRYWYNSEFYAGPGSPVLVFAGQEAEAAQYAPYFLTNASQLNIMAQAIDGALIAVEHRFWGESSPFKVLNTKNLEYLTLEQNIADLNYFAQTVTLPFDKKRTSTPDKAAWLLYGVSYSGAVSAWVASTAPGTYWGYFASSAVVEAISNFWEYFAPETQHMPKNCSADLTLVADYIDRVFAYGTGAEQHALKKMFGLQDVTHANDFAEAIAIGPYLWQSGDITGNNQFLGFCDHVENAVGPNATIPGAKGVGLQKALAGYANWFYTEALPGTCQNYGYQDFNGTYNVACYNTYNASSPIFTDWTVDNTYNRQWNWMLCNEPFGYWQTGAPLNVDTIVSRTIDVHYFTRQCKLFFPDTKAGYTYGLAEGATENKLNKYTGGWDITDVPRLFYINGGSDPWRDATVSSDFRPGGRFPGNANTTVRIIPDGFHGSDISVANGLINAGARRVQNDMVKYAQKYVAEFKAK